jgi:ribosome recycling factor
MDAAKKGKSDGIFTEDQMHDLEKDIQELTVKFIKQIEEKVAGMGKEVLTV